MSTMARRPAPPPPGKAARPAAKPRPAAPKAGPGLPRSIEKLNAIRPWVASQVVGRDDVVAALVLAVAAGTNVLFLGPPGTAKTQSVRLVAQAFADQPGDVFDVLLTKFSKPNEVFGPVDPRSLAQGEIRINTAGFLPAAKVGVLDEMFKGSSAILNSLLTLANERAYRNGAVWEKSPLRMLVGMSNEFPEDATILAAFFDRFPLKITVGYLPSDKFGEMLRAAASPAAGACPAILTDADFAEIDRLRDAVVVPAEMISGLRDIREMLVAKGVVVSDRRYVQALNLLKASAMMAGRASVTRADLKVLEDVCWNTPEDRAVIRGILPQYAAPFEKELQIIADEVHAEANLVIEAVNLKGKDATRPSPDWVKGAEAAARALLRIRSATASLDLVEQDAIEPRDRELIAEARDAVRRIDEAVASVTRGNRDGQAASLLAAIEDTL